MWKEIQEMERMGVPWVCILWGSTVTMWVLQNIVSIFNTHTQRARLCFFFAWHFHRTPSRIRLPLRRFRLEDQTKLDVNAPYFTDPTIHRILGFMLSVCVFFASVSTIHLAWWKLGCVLVVCTVFKLVLEASLYRYPTQGSKFVDLTAKFCVTMLGFGSCMSFFYITQKRQFDPRNNPIHVLTGGLTWPFVRHCLRYGVSLLLVDPRGSKGTVRVYNNLFFDLPVLISIFAQDDMDVVFTLMFCLGVVDAAAVLLFSGVGLQRMISLSNLLWMNFMALSFILTLKGPAGLTTVQVTQRVWYAIMYLSLVFALPQVYRRVGRMVDPARAKEEEEESAPIMLVDPDEERQEIEARRRKSCCPTLHASEVDVPYDSTMDFSESSVAASKHVLHLVKVVQESEAISFALWGVWHAVLYLS